MFKKIRASKFTKVVVWYLVLMIFLEVTQPMAAYALTEGPSQPEFNSFTPIATSDMVDLASGDFNYNIPIMDVGGYPINLAYDSGVTMDQEATWVGLGWNLNIGQINRSVRGLPDDFKGDEIVNENNMKKNLTLSLKPYFNWQLIGFERAAEGETEVTDIGGMSAGIDLRYNNYRGLSAVPSFGMSFNLSDNVSIGADITSSNEEGVTVTPNMSLTKEKNETNEVGTHFFGSGSPSITYNSRQGLQSFNLSSSGGYQKITEDVSGFKKIKEHDGSSSANISFLNTTFTPSMRTPMKNTQFTFSFSTGAAIYGLSGELSVAAGTTIQSIKEKTVVQNAFGYEFTDFGNSKSLLDFNREKEQSSVTKNTMLLPITNYTYDVLTIQSQIGGGTFRPYRGQVGMIYDANVQDASTSTTASLELEGAQGVHVGGNVKLTTSSTRTGGWKTIATPYLKESATNSIDYEKVYFKKVGESRVDTEKLTLLDNKLGGRSPITLKLNGESNDALNRYSKKELLGTGSVLTPLPPFFQPIKRANREKRNSAIQKFTKKEVTSFGMQNIIVPNPYAKTHHTAGYIVTEKDGSRQVFGETAYNISKQEVAFSVGALQGDCETGLVNYYSDGNATSSSYGDDSVRNSKGMENYFNRITTPAYAHTYLLTSVLSTDYEDVSQNGPTLDDLGTFTKFIYTSPGDTEYLSNYKWRVPFDKGKASFNEGYKTDKRDQKGSYLYGVKEVKYVKRIETKTHIAFIDMEARKDGFGVNNKDGGLGTSSVAYKIKSIRLYTRPDAIKALLMDNIPGNDDLSIQPIKTAHFIYDYSLCRPTAANANIDNFNNIRQSGNPLTEIEQSNDGGKLTLKKVYFTYKDSKMGKFMPYIFEYGENNNYSYNVKNYNIWGNYMPNNSCSNPTTLTSPQEFPYVNQDAALKDVQDNYASAWSLKTINLPSGGKIEVTYETDEYQYVQDKKAMRMFKVDGVCGENFGAYIPGNTSNDRLYDGNGSDYVVVNIGQVQSDDPAPEVIAKKYTDGLKGKPVYFNFFLNMIGSNYDYVTGYFEMNGDAKVKSIEGNLYLFVPMKKINREGRSTGTPYDNPISVAGWFFGRQNLPYHIYGQDEPSSDVGANLITLGRSLVSSLDAMTEILIGANGRLKNTFGCAKKFKPGKSWIRLNEPDGIKYGGGSRVKKLMMYDEWDQMIGSSNVTPELNRYKKEYGQEYNYRLDDDNPSTERDESTSSGVATYEPNMGKENPLVQPFYNGAEKLSIPTYQEKPFGESFFPGATVTYSRVEVKNITAADDEFRGSKTKSGVVVTEHYTSKDFPTITDYTDLSRSKDFDTNEEGVILKMSTQLYTKSINVHNYLTMTQGFYIETNDMNGKLKKQSVYNNGKQLISSVEYVYNTSRNNSSVLDNTLPVIDENGAITEEEIATHYDVINDLRESYSKSTTKDINPNVDFIPIGAIPIILGFGVIGKAEHTNILKTAVTTKVVHKTGILKKKIAFDLGSSVTTENLAWDATTGDVLVTKTNNEFYDHYYTVNFPAYWYYKGMGLATNNLGIEGRLTRPTSSNPGYFNFAGTGAQNVFHLGDELDLTSPGSNPEHVKVWVAGFGANESLLLITANGDYLTDCEGDTDYRFKITRSGYRNQQTQSMASITTMINPIDTEVSPGLDKYLYNFEPGNPNKVINASAIEYNDFWRPQAETGRPLYNQSEIGSIGSNGGSAVNYPVKLGFNPYLNNYKADWRPLKSYAYLVGRTNNSGSPRTQGFFKSFTPFYNNPHHEAWSIDMSKWTFASEITQFSPFGPEIENSDALGRFSSAQYGYHHNLPMAVASNSKYQNMGFDGFEESFIGGLGNSINLGDYSHFSFFVENGESSDDVFITSDQSHTGNKSIRVGRDKAIMRKPLFITDVQREAVDCEGGPGEPACPSITYVDPLDPNIFEPSHSCAPNIETDNYLIFILQNQFCSNTPCANDFEIITNHMLTNVTTNVATNLPNNLININGAGTEATGCIAATVAGDYIKTFNISYENSPALHITIPFNCSINPQYDPESTNNNNQYIYTVGTLTCSFATQ